MGTGVGIPFGVLILIGVGLGAGVGALTGAAVGNSPHTIIVSSYSPWLWVPILLVGAIFVRVLGLGLAKAREAFRLAVRPIYVGGDCPSHATTYFPASLITFSPACLQTQKGVRTIFLFPVSTSLQTMLSS